MHTVLNPFYSQMSRYICGYKEDGSFVMMFYNENISKNSHYEIVRYAHQNSIPLTSIRGGFYRNIQQNGCTDKVLYISGYSVDYGKPQPQHIEDMKKWALERGITLLFEEHGNSITL